MHPVNKRAFAMLPLLLATGVAFAAELPAGTVLDKSNIDKVKNDTFAGHTIASLLTERVEWQIKQWNLKITLDPAKPIPIDRRLLQATEKYAGQAKFDPATREVTGYMAGIPFPKISESDPAAGEKIMWNFYYAPQEGDTVYNRYFLLNVSGEKGLETKQDWIFQRFFFKNRVSADEPVVGDGTITAKTFNLAQYPEDIKGIGTFTVRYDSPKLEDNWAYLKSARRARRLSGGAWMDPVGGSDMLGDDIEVINARPSWYQKYKLVGTRWVLAITNSKTTIHDASKAGKPGEFPLTDLENPPHWNPVQKWQPREVYVVEGTPPAEHPYSKRVLYVDKETFRPYFSENYDKKGEFWKFVNVHMRPAVADDGAKIFQATYMDVIDFKSRHAAIIPIYEFRANPKGMNAEYWSLSNLERLSR
ncbi:DUF1329 domain-containing protein [Cupriavidus oxalaticus]|uniref:DUF1329 domain-containing protein n=1 Tax=Cupriavidus oxalaticus TaxID=96344 RepID=UPI003F739C56